MIFSPHDSPFVLVFTADARSVGNSQLSCKFTGTTLVIAMPVTSNKIFILIKVLLIWLVNSKLLRACNLFWNYIPVLINRVAEYCELALLKIALMLQKSKWLENSSIIPDFHVFRPLRIVPVLFTFIHPQGRKITLILVYSNSKLSSENFGFAVNMSPNQCVELTSSDKSQLHPSQLVTRSGRAAGQLKTACHQPASTVWIHLGLWSRLHSLTHHRMNQVATHLEATCHIQNVSPCEEVMDTVDFGLFRLKKLNKRNFNNMITWHDFKAVNMLLVT